MEDNKPVVSITLDLSATDIQKLMWNELVWHQTSAETGLTVCITMQVVRPPAIEQVSCPQTLEI